MGVIDNEITRMRTAVYGEEMRDAIGDAMEILDKDCSDVIDSVDDLNDSIENVETEVADLKSAINAKNGEIFGGNITPIFELGIVYFENNWQYVDSNKRIRFPQGFTIHLQRGCVIGLTDYTDAKFSVGWKINGVNSGYKTWTTEDFTTTVEADYAITVMNITEAAQTSPDALANLVKVINPALMDKEEKKRIYDTGNLIHENDCFPGTINSAGWYVPQQDATQKQMASDFIPVNPGEKYVAYLRNHGSFYIVFNKYSQAKDGNSAFIGRDVFSTGKTDGNEVYGFAEYEIPAGCYFIRVFYYTYGENNYYLFNVTAKEPIGLTALQSYYAGKEANKYYTTGTDYEINLTSYTPVDYNLEGTNNWSASSVYRCVLIPRKDLTLSIDFVAGTYKVGYAFLKSNTIVAGQRADFCEGEVTSLVTAGNRLHRSIPDDCEYLYVYITNGNQFGNFHVINKSLKFDIAEIREMAKGIVYISDVDQILHTIKHRHDGNANAFSGTNVSDNLLVLAHISDIHNDPSAYGRFISFLNENVGICNAGVASGDIVDAGVQSMYDEMMACEESLAEGAKLIKCVGNHERQGMTSEEVYTALHLNTNTGKNYYYIDYATQKIRIICLDQYDVVSDTPTINQATAHYSQTQIEWLIDTLKSAKQNDYSVIVVYHSCNEMGFPAYNSKGFCQNRTYTMHSSPTSGTIIADIIDAYQRGASINKTYTVSDISGTLTVNTTFSGNGIFICYLCGHEHIDYIGYSSVYPNQLVCIVQGAVVESTTRDESTAHWQSMYDTPRVPNTSTVDSINVYGIDTVSRLLKVVKIGSTLTDKFVPRSFATFKY